MIKPVLFALGMTALIAGCQKGPESEPVAEAPSPAASGPLVAVEPAKKETRFVHLEPILRRCLPCHSANGKDGVDMRTFESVMKGGEHGPIVKVGDPANSVLIQALRGTNGKKQMPLKQPPLSEEEIAAVERWIREGAKA